MKKTHRTGLFRSKHFTKMYRELAEQAENKYDLQGAYRWHKEAIRHIEDGHYCVNGEPYGVKDGECSEDLQTALTSYLRELAAHLDFEFTPARGM